MDDAPDPTPTPKAKREKPRAERREVRSKTIIPATSERRSFAERQERLQNPLRDQPDYPKQVRVGFITVEGVSLKITRKAAVISPTPTWQSMHAAYLPRVGDLVETAETLDRVDNVVWSYAIAGPPTVKIVLRPARQQTPGTSEPTT